MADTPKRPPMSRVVSLPSFAELGASVRLGATDGFDVSMMPAASFKPSLELVPETPAKSKDVVNEAQDEDDELPETPAKA